MHPIGSSAWQDARAVVVEIGALFRRWRWWVTLYALAVFGATLFLLRFDRPLFDWFTNIRIDPWINIANTFRRWGDFRDSVTFMVVVFAAGWVFRRRRWRAAAIGCFLAASLAGLAVNVVRFTSGRPRPKVAIEEGLPDRWHGPTFKYKMQSFPSGHAGTSSANGVAWLVAMPGVGVPAFLSGAGVVWSCLYTRVHYGTDVLVGTAIGVLFGVIGGSATRRVCGRLPSRDPPAPGRAGR